MCDLPIQLLLLCDDGVSSPAALVSFSRQKLIAAAEEIKQQAKATKKGGGYQDMSPQCKNATPDPDTTNHGCRCLHQTHTWTDEVTAETSTRLALNPLKAFFFFPPFFFLAKKAAVLASTSAMAAIFMRLAVFSFPPTTPRVLSSLIANSSYAC